MRSWSLRFLHESLATILAALRVLLAAASATLRSRAVLQLENLALRHQLGVLRRSVKRPEITAAEARLAIFPNHGTAKFFGYSGAGKLEFLHPARFLVRG